MPAEIINHEVRKLLAGSIARELCAPKVVEFHETGMGLVADDSSRFAAGFTPSATLQLYSLRDSGIMALLDTELSPREVSEVIGHHDLQSINNYLHHHSDTLVEKTRRNTPRF